MSRRFLDRDSLTSAILSTDGDFPLTVSGTSMMPLMKDGKTTVLLTRNFAPQKGRILLFRRIDGSLVLHRVRKIEKDGTLIMNGDAQNWCERISPSQVIAAVNYISIGKRNVKYNTPLLKIWDSIWYITYPVRQRLFRIAKRR